MAKFKFYADYTSTLVFNIEAESWDEARAKAREEANNPKWHNEIADNLEFDGFSDIIKTK